MTSLTMRSQGALSQSQLFDSNGKPYTKSMIEDVAIEMLRMELHDKSYEIKIPFATFTDSDIANNHYMTQLQAQKLHDMANVTGNQFTKWDEMRQLRDERFDRLDRVRILREHQSVWPIYKYEHEKGIELKSGLVYLKSPQHQKSLRLKESSSGDKIFTENKTKASSKRNNTISALRTTHHPESRMQQNTGPNANVLKNSNDLTKYTNSDVVPRMSVTLQPMDDSCVLSESSNHNIADPKDYSPVHMLNKLQLGASTRSYFTDTLPSSRSELNLKSVLEGIDIRTAAGSRSNSQLMFDLPSSNICTTGGIVRSIRKASLQPPKSTSSPYQRPPPAQSALYTVKRRSDEPMNRSVSTIRLLPLDADMYFQQQQR